MPKTKDGLTAAEEDFCRRTAAVAFSNPFGERFLEAYHIVETGLAKRIDALAARGLAVLGRFSGVRRETMRVVLLFDAYQRFRAALDELVVAQAAAGDTPVPVPFAGELLALLARRGFERDEAVRLLAISFQIRRAHHFIVEGLVGTSACMREFRRRLWDKCLYA